MTQNPQKGCALITGAGGRLGTLLRAARNITANLQTDFRFQSRRPGADICWAPGDDPADLPHCDAVIALWGATSGSDEDLAENARLVSLTSRLADTIGARKIVHLSSAAVYGPGQSMDEGRPVGNCNPYGKSKLDMEDAVAAQMGKDGRTHICLRLANVVGADSLAPALRNSDPARMDDFSPDPTQHQSPLRSYIGASDLLKVFDGLLQLPGDGWPAVLNIACPEPISMDALIYAADKDVIWQQAPSTAAAEVTLDVTRLQALLPSLTFLTTASALVDDWRRLESNG